MFGIGRRSKPGNIDKETVLTVDAEIVQQAVESWKTLYVAATEAEQDRALKEMFASDATFEDPLIKVTNSADIRAQFYALHLLVDHIDVSDVWVKSVYTLAASEPQLAEVEVLDKQVYHLPSGLAKALPSALPRSLPLWSTTTLTLRTCDGKVVAVREEWHNVLGLPGLVKGLLGRGSSWLVRAVENFLD